MIGMLLTGAVGVFLGIVLSSAVVKDYSKQITDLRAEVEKSKARKNRCLNESVGYIKKLETRISQLKTDKFSLSCVIKHKNKVADQHDNIVRNKNREIKRLKQENKQLTGSRR
jgi:hypothetical protein